MNSKFATGLIVVFISCAGSAIADERFSVGFGAGLHYTGYGVSFARQTDESIGYVSIGCVGWASSTEGNCGVSGGFMSNFNFKDPRMTLGFFIVGTEDNTSNTNIETAEVVEEYRLGTSFNYHFGGIKAAGVVAGINGYMYKSDYQSEPGLGLHVGYQW